MKKILPGISIVRLAAVLAALLALSRDVGGQDAASVFDEWDPLDPIAGENVDPYRAEPAADIPAVDVTQQTDGGPLVRAALDRLRSQQTVFARLQHQVTLEGQEFFGSGNYWQQGQGDDLQVCLELQFNDQELSFLQVNDGRKLWIDRRLPTGRSIASYNLRLIRLEDRKERDSDVTLDGQMPSLESGWLATPYDGGLPGLFASLAGKFDFLRPQAMQLSLAPPIVEQPLDIPVYAVVGQWKPQVLTALLSHLPPAADSSEQEAVGGTQPAIPRHIPHEVLLLIGQRDLFPYWIEYRRRETPPPAAAGSPDTFYHLSANPMVVLKFADVTFNAPVAAAQFDYTLPPKVEWSDQTSALIQLMRKERQASVAGASEGPIQR